MPVPRPSTIRFPWTRLRFDGSNSSPIAMPSRLPWKSLSVTTLSLEACIQSAWPPEFAIWFAVIVFPLACSRTMPSLRLPPRSFCVMSWFRVFE